MSEIRKMAAVLAADVVGYSRLAGADEDCILARLRALRSDLIDPTVAVHQGRVFKRTGDGVLVEFRTASDAIRCAIEVQNGMAERNAGLPNERRITFRIGIHVGDVVEEADGDLMGDTVNIAARLQGICEPGGVCVSEDAYRLVRGRLDVEFVDLGVKELKNIARSIRAYQVSTVANGPVAPTTPTGDLSVPAKPSIAVLPFQNLSGDPEQEYFADGVVEDIITGLSRIKWLFVIARNSSFTYKGKIVDVRQVGRELGVRYVLEGGVRKAGGRVRITAQLVEAATGAHLWADRFDGALEDIFELQDQITDQVVAIVEPSLQRSEIERSRRKRPDSLDAYDLFLRAVPYTASQTAEDGQAAIWYLEEALRIEPSYAAAHALAAWCYEWCYSRGGFQEANKEAALRHARAALVGGTDDATALAIAGFVTTMLSQDHEAGLSAIERALTLNPSCATALYLGAVTNAFAGHPAAATAQASRALRLSPFDLLVYLAYLAQGTAAVQEGRHDDAAAAMQRMLQANSSLSSLYFIAAAALALGGRLEAARAWAAQGLKMEPGFQCKLFSELITPQIANRLAEGGRLLGLPG
jgi:TolB-like protein